MPTLVTVSLWINVVVLWPVCISLVANTRGAEATFGARTPARGILLAVYLSILCVSMALLLLGSTGAAATLLFVQIVYKVVTPFSVGRLRHPVVLSNLAIAAFHTATLSVTGLPIPR